MLYTVLALIALVVLIATSLRQVTIYEYERGLRYAAGRFTGVLQPGSYWIVPLRTRILKVDVRPHLVTVPGQEVISADGVGVKITLAAQYRVTDPARAVHSIDAYTQAAYLQLQLALREAVATRAAEDLLSSRAALGEALQAAAAPKLAELGLELIEAGIKDIMFPGDLKKVFSQVVRARQEGLAALEKARGETAALRNLANAASLLESRPSLLTLRLLQVLGQESGNSVVLNLAGGELLPVRGPAARGAPGERDTNEA